MRRLSLAAATVVMGALVFTTSAQACSCAPFDPAEGLRRADAAIVGSLIKVMPRGRLKADFRYRVQRVYRGAKMIRAGEVISVRSARGAAACGLPRRQDHPLGLFLLLDGRRWTAGICSTVQPRRLGAAAKRGYGGGHFSASSSCTS